MYKKIGFLLRRVREGLFFLPKEKFLSLSSHTFPLYV